MGPIPLATQLQESKLCLDESSLQEAAAAISLQSIKKERDKSIAKALSIPRWKDGKNILPSRKDMITFNCKLFSVSYSSCLTAKPEYLPQTYGGGILPWPQISLVSVAMLDSRRWKFVGNCYILLLLLLSTLLLDNAEGYGH